MSGGGLFPILFVFHILQLNSDTTFYISLLRWRLYLDKVIGICGRLAQAGRGLGLVLEKVPSEGS